MHKEIIDFINQIQTEDPAKKVLLNYLKNNNSNVDPDLESIFLNMARLLIENKKLQGHERELKTLVKMINDGENEINQIDKNLATLESGMNPPQL